MCSLAFYVHFRTLEIERAPGPGEKWNRFRSLPMVICVGWRSDATFSVFGLVPFPPSTSTGSSAIVRPKRCAWGQRRSPVRLKMCARADHGRSFLIPALLAHIRTHYDARGRVRSNRCVEMFSAAAALKGKIHYARHRWMHVTLQRNALARQRAQNCVQTFAAPPHRYRLLLFTHDRTIMSHYTVLL